MVHNVSTYRSIFVREMHIFVNLLEAYAMDKCVETLNVHAPFVPYDMLPNFNIYTLSCCTHPKELACPHQRLT